MPGNPRDRRLAEQEGARFRWLAQPVGFRPGEDGRLAFMDCVEMRLDEPDLSGRRRPLPVDDSQFAVEVDTVILALGYLGDPATIGRIPGLEADAGHLVVIDPQTGATSREGLYAGGDSVLGPALVVTAVAQGRRAAEAMHGHMTAERLATHGAERA